MGQRLNIEILKGNKVLANAYYHWSAYTESALELCKEIVEVCNKIVPVPGMTCDSTMFEEELYHASEFSKQFHEPLPNIEKVKVRGQYTSADADRLLAIRLLESTGAGINEEEYKRIVDTGMCAGITFRTAISRNEGLISVTEEGIEENRNWQEGQVTIDLDNKRVLFGVFWATDKDEYLEEYGIDPDEEPERVPMKVESSIDIEDFAFSEIDDVIALVKKTESTGILDKSGVVYSWIA